MMNIFICGFDEKYTKELEKVIQEELHLASEESIKYRLFHDGPIELIKALNKNVLNGLYFFPIRMDGPYNGIEIGQKIRQLDPLCKIVYITSLIELTGWIINNKIEVLDILQKKAPELLRSDLYECILETHKRNGNSNNIRNNCISINCDEEILFLRMSDIYYFETSTTPHKIIVYTIKGNFEFYGKMKDICNKSSSFFRCHKSYIVNLNNIKCISKKSRMITLGNDLTCFFSEKAYRDLINEMKNLIEFEVTEIS